MEQIFRMKMRQRSSDTETLFPLDRQDYLAGKKELDAPGAIFQFS